MFLKTTTPEKLKLIESKLRTIDFELTYRHTVGDLKTIDGGMLIVAR